MRSTQTTKKNTRQSFIFNFASVRSTIFEDAMRSLQIVTYVLLLLLLLAFQPVHLFPHRSSRHLNLERPTESTAIKIAETGSPSTSSPSLVDAQQQPTIHESTAAVRETLNSPNAAFVVTSADDYRKPAFARRMKQFMEKSNTDIVYVIDNDAKGNAENVFIDVIEKGERNGRQLSSDGEPATPSSSTSSGTGFFSIIPISFDWRHTIAAPFAAIYAPATADRPLRIWAIGSVAKFPPFIEHFVQRIQAHYSVYKYEDLSRPGIHHSDSANEVVRVTTSSKSPVAETIDDATESKNDDHASAAPSGMAATPTTTASNA